MLMSLPECLSWIILDSWLPEKCIPRLDSALCQLSTRKLFLTLLTTHAFTHREIRYSQSLKWMLARSLTAISITINNSSHYLDKRLLRKYCQTNAGVVRKIIVRDSENDVINIVAHTCQNLAEYRGSNANVFNLSLLLEMNPKLEHLATVLTGGIADEFGDVSLPLLRSAVIIHRDGHLNYVDALIRMAPNLAKLTILYKNSVISTSTVLSTPCPKLKSLRLPKVLHGDIIVAEATLMCPNLLHLDLQICDSITDTGVLSVVNNSTALRSLNLKNCRKITDQSMHLLVARVWTQFVRVARIFTHSTTLVMYLRPLFSQLNWRWIERQRILWTSRSRVLFATHTAIALVSYFCLVPSYFTSSQQRSSSHCALFGLNCTL